MDLQLKISAVEMAHCDRIVEIARSFAVDGDDRQRTEITAMKKFRGRDDGRNVLSFFKRGCGEMMGQMKFADRDFNVDSEIVLPAENFNDPSSRILRGSGPVGNFNIDDYAFEIVPLRRPSGFVTQHAVNGLFLWRRRLAGFFANARNLSSGRNHIVHCDVPVHRLRGIVAAAVMKNPHYRGMRAYYRPHDAAFGAAIGTSSDDVDQHAVAVHRISDGVRRDKNIA